MNYAHASRLCVYAGRASVLVLVCMGKTPHLPPATKFIRCTQRFYVFAHYNHQVKQMFFAGSQIPILKCKRNTYTQAGTRAAVCWSESPRIRLRWSKTSWLPEREEKLCRSLYDALGFIVDDQLYGGKENTAHAITLSVFRTTSRKEAKTLATRGCRNFGQYVLLFYIL